MLPDELLVCILSLLSFKEATATSTLCRRWKHLHNFTGNLDFDGTKVSEKALDMNSEDFEELRQKFLGWVDGVVRLNQSSRLEKFRISFHLRESDAQRIDEWVRFALSRKVESIELVSFWVLDEEVEYYSLNWNYDFNFMKKLSTHRVKVSGEAVEMLLRNCPLLEQLSITKSNELLGLEIIKPFPIFRSLEIVECWNLSSVVVYDSNIVSFKYCGSRSKVVLVSVPLLTEIWIYGMCTNDAKDVLEMFSSVLPQLHTLKICVLSPSSPFLCNLCSRFFQFVEMSNLKQLVVDIADIYDGQDLLPLIDLIKASPGLQRFVIEEPYEEDRADDFVEVIPIEIPMASSAGRMILKANTELKEVEFVGYRGVSRQFELLKYLVENAIALETIAVDLRGFTRPTCSFDCIPRHKYDEEVFARANAQLKYLVPFGINVKIL